MHPVDDRPPHELLAEAEEQLRVANVYATMLAARLSLERTNGAGDGTLQRLPAGSLVRLSTTARAYADAIDALLQRIGPDLGAQAETLAALTREREMATPWAAEPPPARLRVVPPLSRPGS